MKSLISSSMFLIILIALSGFIHGCSTAPTSSNKAGTIKKPAVLRVQNGTITEVKSVMVVDPRANTRVLGSVGSIAGSLIGASAGAVGGSLIGSMVGSAVGNSAEKGLRKKPGLEIGLKLDSGEKVIVTQIVSQDHTFKSGDKVKLVQNEKYAQVQHL